MASSYLVCATPRTGSSLLLGLLESTGVAGHPQAYFRTPDEPLWAERWGLPRTYGYDEYVRAVLAHGRTGNGVFGAKLMWDTFLEVRGKLPASLLTKDVSRFVYVHRDDTVAQAISWLRAEQTGTWFLGGNGEIGSAAPTGATAYDQQRLTELIRTIEEHKSGWEAWFASTGVTPHRVRYEDLAADPVAVTHGVLAFLGLRLPDGRDLTPRHRRQADGLNAEWADRYRASRTA